MCWERVVAPLTTRVPVLLTEMGEDDCSSRYMDRLMAWADAHGIGYLAWTWNTPGHRGCIPNGGADGDIFVIASYDGTPFPGMGVGFKEHLRCLASGRCRVTTPRAAAGTSARYWSPVLRSTFQWQLTGTVDRSYAADVYDIDLFDTPAATVAALHRRGRHVICYLSLGSYETWRPDASRFPRSVIGKPYQGWPGEWWLDVRNITGLAPSCGRALTCARPKASMQSSPTTSTDTRRMEGRALP